MKKLKLLLAVAVVFTLISTIAFASTPFVSVDIPEYSGTGDLVVSISIDQTDSVEFYSQLVFDNTVWKYKSALKSDGSSFNADDANNNGESNVIDIGISNPISVESGKAFLNIVFEPINVSAASGSKFYLRYASTADDCDFSATEENPVAVTVKKTDVIVEPETTTEVEGYTDVVNFASSATAAEGATTLSFDLYEGDAKHGETYSVNLADWGLTIESGTINFKVAIIGAPATGVTLRNPVVK